MNSLLKNDHILPVNYLDKKIITDFKSSIQIDILHEYNQKYNFQSFDSSEYHYEITDFKVQKTLPTEGYHIWHYENEMLDVRSRILTWTLYLNDVNEGGETEFLHQSLRIKPKQGTIVVWPAGFTHIHRGNPPLSGEKYIVTGWVEVVSN